LGYCLHTRSRRRVGVGYSSSKEWAPAGWEVERVDFVPKLKVKAGTAFGMADDWVVRGARRCSRRHAGVLTRWCATSLLREPTSTLLTRSSDVFAIPWASIKIRADSKRLVFLIYFYYSKTGSFQLYHPDISLSLAVLIFVSKFQRKNHFHSRFTTSNDTVRNRGTESRPPHPTPLAQLQHPLGDDVALLCQVGVSPIYVASECGHLAVATRLIEAKADLKANKVRWVA
jgi:hypothetical protein